MDYTKTYVRVTSQEEYTKALDFYKSKGFNKNSLYANRKDRNNRKCLSISNIDNDIVWSDDMDCIDITEKVLGGKKTIPENTAVRITSKREFDLLMNAYEKRRWKWSGGGKPKTLPPKRERTIDSLIKNGENTILLGDYFYWSISHKYTISFEEAMKILGEDIPKEEKNPDSGLCKEQLGIDIGSNSGDRKTITFTGRGFGKTLLQQLKHAPFGDDYFFIPSQPTKMTQINTDLFERFIKGTKTQVLDSVERAEDSLEERNKLIDTIKEFYNDYKTSKESLERAYNQQDKQSIKKYLKEVQSKEYILKDELFTKQLFPVIKSINKVLDKSNTKK